MSDLPTSAFAQRYRLFVRAESRSPLNTVCSCNPIHKLVKVRHGSRHGVQATHNLANAAVSSMKSVCKVNALAQRHSCLDFLLRTVQNRDLAVEREYREQSGGL